jgi:hypothetical protein
MTATNDTAKFPLLTELAKLYTMKAEDALSIVSPEVKPLYLNHLRSFLERLPVTTTIKTYCNSKHPELREIAKTLMVELASEGEDTLGLLMDSLHSAARESTEMLKKDNPEEAALWDGILNSSKEA